MANREIKVSLADEDCHTLIENYLVEHLGETGRKSTQDEAEMIRCWLR